MRDMSANIYEELNRAIAALGSTISTVRYGDNRGGIVPVSAMPEALALIADAASIITYFDGLNHPLKVELGKEWFDDPQVPEKVEGEWFDDPQVPEMESTDDLMRKFFPDSREDLGSSLEE